MESKIRDLRQEIFKFEQLSNFDKNDFFVSECNYFAFNLIKSWPNWEKKILNIYGERKSGKSHLSEIFLENEKGIKFEFKSLSLVSISFTAFTDVINKYLFSFSTISIKE